MTNELPRLCGLTKFDCTPGGGGTAGSAHRSIVPFDFKKLDKDMVVDCVDEGDSPMVCQSRRIDRISTPICGARGSSAGLTTRIEPNLRRRISGFSFGSGDHGRNFVVYCKCYALLTVKRVSPRFQIPDAGKYAVSDCVTFSTFGATPGIKEPISTLDGKVSVSDEGKIGIMVLRVWPSAPASYCMRLLF